MTGRRWYLIHGTHRTTVGELSLRVPKAGVRAVALELASALRTPIEVMSGSPTDARLRVHRNPTLVHHGVAGSASWHIVTESKKPVADLYGFGQPQARRIGTLLANLLGEPVRVLDNATLPAEMAGHRRLFIGERGNPNPKGRKIGPGDRVQYADPAVRSAFPHLFGTVIKVEKHGASARHPRAGKLVAQVQWDDRSEPNWNAVRALILATPHLANRRGQTFRRRATSRLPRKQRRAVGSGQFVKAQHYASRSITRAVARRESARRGNPSRSGRLRRASPAPSRRVSERAGSRPNPKGPKPTTVREAIATVIDAARFPVVAKEVRSGKQDPVKSLEFVRRFMNTERQRAIIDQALRLARRFPGRLLDEPAQGNRRRSRPKKNPRLHAGALKKAREWHDSPSYAPRATRVKVPPRPRALAKLGDLIAVTYKSDKYAGTPDNPSGRPQLYEHRTKRPHPVLASDPAGHVHIVGGRMKPTADGLVN